MTAFILAIYRAIVKNIAASEILGVWPTSADGVAAAAVQLTSNAAAWTWGAWAEIVSAVNNTDGGDIYGLTLENFVGAVGQGEVQIGVGAGGAEVAIARVPIVGADQNFPIVSVALGVRIACRYRQSVAAANNVSVKLKRRIQ